MLCTDESKPSEFTAVIKLPVSNPNGIPCFADFLREVQRRFDVEKDLKNLFCAYLILKELMDDFIDVRDCVDEDGKSLLSEMAEQIRVPGFTE